MRDERDDRIESAIRKTLAALCQAAPPDGLEERIEQRLQQLQRTAALRPGWRDILRGSTVAGGWLRGAFSGACLAIGLVAIFLWLHRSKPITAPSYAVNANSGLTQTFPKLVIEQHAHPCTPALLQAQTAPAPHSTEIARGALPENHREPLELPLTRQERDLVRLVHLAGPAQLADMTNEGKAQSQAEDAAAFQKFFTPSPRPKVDQEAATPPSTAETATANQTTETKPVELADHPTEDPTMQESTTPEGKQ